MIFSDQNNGFEKKNSSQKLWLNFDFKFWHFSNFENWNQTNIVWVIFGSKQWWEILVKNCVYFDFDLKFYFFNFEIVLLAKKYLINFQTWFVTKLAFDLMISYLIDDWYHFTVMILGMGVGDFQLSSAIFSIFSTILATFITRSITQYLGFKKKDGRWTDLFALQV